MLFRVKFTKANCSRSYSDASSSNFQWCMINRILHLKWHRMFSPAIQAKHVPSAPSWTCTYASLQVQKRCQRKWWRNFAPEGFWYVAWWNLFVLLLNPFGLAMLGNFTPPRTRHLPSLKWYLIGSSLTAYEYASVLQPMVVVLPYAWHLVQRVHEPAHHVLLQSHVSLAEEKWRVN